MKHAVIITKSTNFEPRAEAVGEYLKARGVEVTWLYSDYSHREKKKLGRSEAGHIYIDTVPYRKNLSWDRIRSQMDFARKAGEILGTLDFDLLYVLIPGNSLVPVAVQAAERQRQKQMKQTGQQEAGRQEAGVKLIFDIIDLWPESLRLGKLEQIWPFTYWKGLRDRDLNKADLVVTECDFYREQLGLDPERSCTMYWGKKDTKGVQNRCAEGAERNKDTSANESESTTLQIAYLGAINNIIDIDGIVRLLKLLNRRLEENADGRCVLLQVIGDGENRDTFLQALEKAGIRCEYHGAVFDEQEKRRILSACSYGLNMMKPGITVGMTMKSIDYWSFGLPVINNIPGDTRRLCAEDGMGLNIDLARYDRTGPEPAVYEAKLQESIGGILEGRLTDAAGRAHIRAVYEDLFTEEAMENTMDRIFG